VLLALCVAGCQLLPTEWEPWVSPFPDPLAPRLPAAETRHFDAVSPTDEVVGMPQVLFTRYEDTFSAIAREYNVGYEALRNANPSVDHWLPGEDTPVYLPTQLVLPAAPQEGIVLNVATMRLFYYTERDGERQITTHPIGIGRTGWATPTGSATVTDKARDPVWYVPASVRREHAELGDPLPAMVPPGPDNPLGGFALGLSMPGYLIHGTNMPAGVGMRISHGCVRLYPEDVEVLFERVDVGTPVHIVDQPVLAGWHDGQLLLEVHRPLEEDQRDPAAEAERVIAAAMERVGETQRLIDSERVRLVVEERRGMPFPVLIPSPSPGLYLASARIIENTTPLPAPAAAARAD